jgi:hypothetical protein
MVILLAGGYGPSAWRQSARFFGTLLAGRVREPPPNEEMTLARFRHLARLLDPVQLTGMGPADEWRLTDEDIVAGLDPYERQDRLLGYYSPHGVELALERYGFLSQIRALGFKEPELAIDLGGADGDRIRIHGDSDRSELLLELCLRRERRAVPGMELLLVDWLLLQNPRAAFAPERPALPGQKHPGLGLLDEVVALLILICDRLRLDGLLYVPSHYHLAELSERRGLRFLRRADQARFEAMRAACAGLSLLEASWALEQGLVVDARTAEPVQWRGEPMVLPVTERLRQRLEQPPPEGGAEPEA